MFYILLYITKPDRYHLMLKTSPRSTYLYLLAPFFDLLALFFDLLALQKFIPLNVCELFNFSYITDNINMRGLLIRFISYQILY